MNGHGNMMYSNGDLYEGEWKNGKVGRFPFLGSSFSCRLFCDNVRNLGDFGTFLVSCLSWFLLGPNLCSLFSYKTTTYFFFLFFFPSFLLLFFLLLFQRHGQGMFVCHNGMESYIGGWENDKRDGQVRDTKEDENERNENENTVDKSVTSLFLLFSYPFIS